MVDQSTSYIINRKYIEHQRSCHINFEKDSIGIPKGQLPFIRVEGNWRATSPPPKPTISPNTSNQNFEMAILFDIIERCGYYVFEDDNIKISQIHLIKILK